MRLAVLFGALLALSPLLVTSSSGVAATRHAAPPTAQFDSMPAGQARPADGVSVAAAETRALRGLVLVSKDGRARRYAGAHIGTGVQAYRTDEFGRFKIPSDERNGRLSVVAAGYHVVRKQITADYVVVLLHPLEVRAIYLPYVHLRNPRVLEWALGLAHSGAINSLVIDVKDEGGNLLSIVANETAAEINAIRDPGTDVVAFLDALERLGVYRIARVVTFLDSRFAFAFPSEALQEYDGTVFRDGSGLAWSSAFSPAARQHNVEIGVNAARFFEEIQYDYVRLATDAGVAQRDGTTSAQRSAVIAQFAQEAAAALHAAGAAISFDTFGLTTMAAHDHGIGQVLEDLGPHLDYFSPMVYPSTWTPGWFGLAYPPADPFRVVQVSIQRAVDRLASYEGIVVRPWLQDFHDYGVQRLFYGSQEVMAQIDATALAGGKGFMLWDSSLNYEIGAAECVRALPEVFDTTARSWMQVTRCIHALAALPPAFAAAAK